MDKVYLIMNGHEVCTVTHDLDVAKSYVDIFNGNSNNFYIKTMPVISTPLNHNFAYVVTANNKEITSVSKISIKSVSHGILSDALTNNGVCSINHGDVFDIIVLTDNIYEAMTKAEKELLDYKSNLSALVTTLNVILNEYISIL